MQIYLIILIAAKENCLYFLFFHKTLAHSSAGTSFSFYVSVVTY